MEKHHEHTEDHTFVECPLRTLDGSRLFYCEGTGVIIALIISVLMNFGSYWFSDSIVLKMYDAHPVTRQEAPNLYNAVESLAAKAKIPIPKVYIIPSQTPNAFATGRNEDHAAVAVTTGILKTLNQDELEGVIAHELSHIKHKDIPDQYHGSDHGQRSVMLSRWAMFFGSDDRTIGVIAMAIVSP